VQVTLECLCSLNLVSKKITQYKYKKLDSKLCRLSQEKKKEKQLNFYHRIINNANATSSRNEIALLEKRPKYNLHNKKKDWLVNLALEFETAVSLLLIADREYYRKHISDHLNKLKAQNKTNPLQTTHSEFKTVKSVPKKT
jgi:hypothetical protein